MRAFAPCTRWIVAAALLAAGSVNAQTTLYGISFSGPDGPSTLHTLDVTSGAATPVGPVGFDRCSGMDFNSAGVLYATCERPQAPTGGGGGADTPVLITINTTTGAGTEVGPTGISGAVSDISFRPSDGVLFAYDASNDPEHTLYTINVNTGVATLVGETGLDFAGGNGMTFSAGGVLYHSQLCRPRSIQAACSPASSAP